MIAFAQGDVRINLGFGRYLCLYQDSPNYQVSAFALLEVRENEKKNWMEDACSLHLGNVWSE